MQKITHTVIIAYDFDHILNYEEKEKTYACKIGDGSVRTAKGYDVWCADPDITGQNDLTVENYKGILEYREDKIRLSLKQGQVEICGTHLKIEYYTGEDMKISGQIDKLEYGR